MKIQTLLRHGRRNAPAPGTPAWRRYLTASKISAVMRTSPWQTRFQLWHEMAGNIEPSPPHPAVLERGRALTRDGVTIARRTARKTKTGVPYITFTKEAGK